MKQIESFIPAFELDVDTLKIIQKLAGKQFNNKDLSINFNGMVKQIPKNEFIVELSIDYPGISGKFYILYSELQRILGLNINLLSKEYVEYVFNRHVGCYGIQFKQHIDENENKLYPLLVSATTSLQSKQYSIYFQLNELIVDTDFLSSKKCNWPSTLELSLDITIAQVVLDSEMLQDLSNDDLVLLRNR